MPKVAVYAIALNEERHVERWAASCAEADVRVILDTGSTDRTAQLAREAGVTVYESAVSPWRFDTARNMALALVPEDVDYCVTLDLDEVLLPGWRAAFDDLDPSVTRPQFRYIFHRDAEGREAFTFTGHSCHARHGYEWRGSIHEAVCPTGAEVRAPIAFTVEHMPDPGKDRSQYLTLLARAVEEAPDDSRLAFYYGRELMFRGENGDAEAELRRYLAMDSGHYGERAWAMRYLAGMSEAAREPWLLRACAEMPWAREPWTDLALHYYRAEMWEPCLAAATRALAIEERPGGWFCEPYAWGAMPDDLAAIASYHLGLHERAVAYGTRAADLEPADPRLTENLAFYTHAAGVAV
jgi:glycosyltransferase involved in cell wall biosynthesis